MMYHYCTPGFLVPRLSRVQKRSPGIESGAAKPRVRNGYLVVFSFEPLWLLVDMYILLWCLVV
jgi:hypothetical protein